MNLAERLRDVVRSGPAKAGPHVQDHDRGGRLQPAQDVAETLGGAWREALGHRYLVVDTRYAPGHRHGRVAVADCLPDDEGIWPRLRVLEPRATPGRMLFVDLETTGLAGGAGTYAFLVGCGWFKGAAFHVRQFFLSSFAAERALLEAVAADADDAATLVTYNGKSFDLPLIETRFLLHRLETPFAGRPHVDMLHPARRLWRSEDAEDSCRLTMLERALLGHVREGDVPGFEIPARYFHYVRTGDARPLSIVLEHNRQDILALALLTARAAQLLEEGPSAVRTAREALGLGRLYERAAIIDLAKQSYRRAAAAGPAEAGPHACEGGPAGKRGSCAGGAEPAKAGPHSREGEDDNGKVQAEALRSYAVLCRRGREFDEAATAWRQILQLRRCPPHVAREATDALAVHHEHRQRDLQAARTFALQALQFNVSVARAQAAQHRLARLDRKLGVSSLDEAQLF